MAMDFNDGEGRGGVGGGERRVHALSLSARPPPAVTRTSPPPPPPRPPHPSPAVAAADLEDRDASDSWTVGSRPQAGGLPPNASRVGAFAAAAGRGATAFVEAFRSVVGNHRTTYQTRHSGNNH